MKTLGEVLPEEMARVRDELIPIYESIGISGIPCLLMMRRSLDLAAKAMAEGDIVAMVESYKDLSGYKC